jgi:hypothetical protein
VRVDGVIQNADYACRRYWPNSLDAGSTPAISTIRYTGRAVIEATGLERLARLLYGEQRAAELIPLASGLLAGLEIVARADLTGEDEPDFLDDRAE